jgi:hypothetical protein
VYLNIQKAICKVQFLLSRILDVGVGSENGSDTFFWTVGSHTDCTALRPRRRNMYNCRCENAESYMQNSVSCSTQFTFELHGNKAREDIKGRSDR